MRARLTELATDRRDAGAALPAFTCYDLATAAGVTDAAVRTGSPVALLVSPRTAAGPHGLGLVRALRALADHAPVPVSLQLDHATDPELIEAAVEAGADAVLADGSRGGEEANAAFVAAVRKRLAARFPHVTVEAELGRIEGNEDVAAVAAQVAAGALTDPGRVGAFLDRSGADLLAVSLGNVHGRYPAPPALDWARLASIRELTGVPLVLHGASGLPPADLARAIGHGVCKVNINTELRATVFDTLTAEVPAQRDRGLNMDALLAAWSAAVTERAEAAILALSPAVRSDVVRSDAVRSDAVRSSPAGPGAPSPTAPA
ncbi:class II fructose-bisphosphate aldolase [Streptomyces sp. NPDC093085]|uniref:class II fructose-bisphosphate aldolase n=1 Tax=Streptomyces sp. NPDC093085 TaxID=3155068 RepID=UPI003446D144